MRKNYLKKSYTKYGGETNPKPFSEKSKLSISLDQYPEGLNSLVILYANLMAVEIHWK